MAEGYHVDPERLGAHQHDAEQAAATGKQVADAGHQVTPGGWDNAYGLMFQMFPQATRPIAEAFISFASDAAQALQNTATAIGTAAKKYENNDQDAADSLRKLGQQVENTPEMHVGGGAPAAPPRTEGQEV
ncbi:type VII secretion target [Amycolatopsis sp. CA-230715]|uniref:type VII secretion target n=1 Tax=Amycolatopsis sp. CA-230715 TaxID=2745196 RepID=UPI001C01799C|nr:type VII secretion target [Amycolatopsis sp. CA-230715]QWF84343.1 hypothetical protein HUW46_07793 [Amycolatopsis sp. CA-230715]